MLIVFITKRAITTDVAAASDINYCLRPAIISIIYPYNLPFILSALYRI